MQNRPVLGIKLIPVYAVQAFDYCSLVALIGLPKRKRGIGNFFRVCVYPIMVARRNKQGVFVRNKPPHFHSALVGVRGITVAGIDYKERELIAVRFIDGKRHHALRKTGADYAYPTFGQRNRIAPFGKLGASYFIRGYQPVNPGS